MKRFTNSRKFLFGLSVSMVLAMAIGSFALGESQTPASPQAAEAQSLVGATAGAFTVNGGTQGTDYDYASPVLTIHSGNLTISTTAQTAERIVVDGAATITLAGVNIDRSSETENTAALTITDDATFNVNILLADGSINSLKGNVGSRSSPGSPGIQKNGSGASIGTLTIGVPDGSAGTGKLEATGGYEAAGIGGGNGGSASNITISGGEVTATGTGRAAGIGGGRNGSGSYITISGGEVTATGGGYGAGIGGAAAQNGSNITISGGVVTANGGTSANYSWPSAIGGGDVGGGANNTLNGDAVLFAGSRSSSRALVGFVDDQGNSLLTNGIVFIGESSSSSTVPITWGASGTMYGDSTTISQNVKFPTDLTIGTNQSNPQELIVDTNATLTIPAGVTLQNEGTLTINGTVDCQYDQAAGTTGEVTTKTDFYLEGSTDVYATGYQTYQTNAGVQNYSNLPNPYQDPSNGKRLINWYYLDQSGQQVPISESINVLLNEHSFYENSVEQFTVTFSVPTGTVPATQTIDDGGMATVPQISWTGGTVEGWYTDQAFTPANKWNFSTSTVTGDITLYAKFQCTVTFDPNYSGGSEATSQTVVYDNTVPEPDEPTRDGYSIEGWYKEAECTNLWDFENDRVQGDMTLYAKWIVAEHRVIIPTSPDDHGTVTTDPENPKTGEEVIITVTPEEGYKVDGLPIVKTEDGRIIEVVPTGNPNEYKFIMPDSDVTIEVHFVLISEPEVKTGDSFAGFAALAILGLATTGAALLRKRK